MPAIVLLKKLIYSVEGGLVANQVWRFQLPPDLYQLTFVFGLVAGGERHGNDPAQDARPEHQQEMVVALELQNDLIAGFDAVLLQVVEDAKRFSVQLPVGEEIFFQGRPNAIPVFSLAASSITSIKESAEKTGFISRLSGVVGVGLKCIWLQWLGGMKSAAMPLRRLCRCTLPGGRTKACHCREAVHSRCGMGKQKICFSGKNPVPNRAGMGLPPRQAGKNGGNETLYLARVVR